VFSLIRQRIKTIVTNLSKVLSVVTDQSKKPSLINNITDYRRKFMTKRSVADEEWQWSVLMDVLPLEKLSFHYDLMNNRISPDVAVKLLQSLAFLATMNSSFAYGAFKTPK
jgi:hypothetical protein